MEGKLRLTILAEGAQPVKALEFESTFISEQFFCFARTPLAHISGKEVGRKGPSLEGGSL